MMWNEESKHIVTKPMSSSEYAGTSGISPYSNLSGDHKREDLSYKPLFTLPLFQWKVFLLFATCCVAIIAQWFLTSDLFQIPTDIATSRKHFFQAKERYKANAAYWDAKQRQFTEYIWHEIEEEKCQHIIQHLQEAPHEVLISFLTHRLHLNMERQDQLTIFPKEETPPLVFILSKYEQGIWPLKIMLSLELEARFINGKFSLTFCRLRRGVQDVALGLAWAYFGPELERLRDFGIIPSQTHFLPSAQSAYVPH